MRCSTGKGFIPTCLLLVGFAGLLSHESPAQASVAPRPNIMSLAQQIDDLFLCGVHLIGIAHLHVDVAQSRPAGHALHRAGVGHDDDVILIRSLGAEPFRREHASD